MRAQRDAEPRRPQRLGTGHPLRPSPPSLSAARCTAAPWPPHSPPRAGRAAQANDHALSIIVRQRERQEEQKQLRLILLYR